MFVTAGNRAGRGISSNRRGLFDPLLLVPIKRLTMLTTAIGTGATITDTDAGIYITGANTVLATASSPGTPYKITALLLGNSAQTPTIGFSDGTKYQYLYPSGTQVIVQNNSALATFFATVATATTTNFSNYYWLQIQDDGTTVYFRYSYDGVNWQTLYSVSKAAGHLGAAGYTRVFAGALTGAAASFMTVASWTVG